MIDDPKVSGNSVETALASLQPIRDLAKNWDIDIATCLEEYLQDLVGNLTEEERRNLPKHAESLNFSQAALVLQNSSNVYSRKVEYLYKLVVQVHDELIQSSASGNSSSANGSSRKSSVDAQIEEFNSFDPHSEFLLLDDCLPVAENGKKINLQETRDDVSRDGGLSFATAATTTRLSLGATMATNMERSVTPGAGVFATQHITSGSFNTGSLRLIDGKCDVGEDGILILPGAGRKSEEKIRRSSIFGNNMSPRSRSNAFDQQSSQPQSGSDSFAMDGGDIYDDGGDDGGGFGFGDDDDNGFGDENAGVENTTVQSGHQQSSQQRGITSSTDKSTPMEKKADPWALLDAHSHGTLTKSREHKFGTTCKLPPGVSELPSEINKESRTKKSRRITPTKISARRAKCSRQSLALESFKSNLFAQRRRNKILANSSNKNGVFGFDVDMPEIPMKGLIFGDEFLYIANETARLKRALARDESKQSKIAQQNMEEKEHNKYVDDDDGFGAMDYGGDDDDGGDYGFGGDDDDQQDEIGNTGVGNLDDMFKSHHHEGDDDGIETEGKTFEELCRAHIQAFAKGAEAYAAETRLSKRVGDWHDNLIPILENEEHRPEFDIYDYTMRVVSTCENELNDENGVGKKRTIGFEAVTRDCERFEVCRLFLSVLALSNSGNVKLHHGDFDDNLELTLLDANLDRPMETYLAPSVVEDE